jgi:glycosyltransferase involved in cell wall biosynthesis
MKVLCISPSYWPAFQYGGTVFAAHYLNKALIKNGVEVAVYAAHVGVTEYPANRPVMVDGVPVTFFDIVKLFEFMNPTGWQYSPKMSRAFKENLRGFDIVHIHALWNYPAAAAAHYCRKYGVPYIITLHGLLYPYTYQKRQWKKMPYYYLIARRDLKRASLLHFTTEDERAKCLPLWALSNPSCVVYNAIDTAEFSSLPPREALSRRYPQCKNKTVVLFLGRIHWKKGIDFLVEAFAALWAKRKDIHLVLAGNSEAGYGDKMKQLIRDRGLAYVDISGAGATTGPVAQEPQVTFTGMVMGAQKAELFAGSDMFVLPSHSENFGMSVAEAMACGLPVIVSDQVAVCAEVLAAGAGIAVKPAAVSVEQGLSELLDDKEKRSRMGENGKRLVAEKFSLEKVGRGMLGAYNQVLAEKHRSGHHQ